MVLPILEHLRKDSFMGMVISKEGSSISMELSKMELLTGLENT